MSMNDFRIEGNTLVKYTGNDASVVVPAGVRIIGGQAFGYNSTLISVVIPEGVVTIGERAFDSCQNLVSVIIPSTVALIEKNAFVACRSLEKIVIPGGVPFIAAKTFYGCRSLKSVVIPDSVTAIGDEAFRRCTSLTEITVGDNVTEIGQEAFAECLELKTVVLGKGIGLIRWNTFSNCRSLTKVGLSEGLYEVEYGAFDNCSSVTDVYFYGSEEAWRMVTIKPPRNESVVRATLHIGYTKPITEAGKAHSKKVEPTPETALQITFDILDDIPMTEKVEEEPAPVEVPAAQPQDLAQIEIAIPEVTDVPTKTEEAVETEEQSSAEETVEEAPEAEVVEAPVVETPVIETPAVETPVPQPAKPEKKRSTIRTTPKAAVSDVTEAFKKEFYEGFIALIPEDLAAEQKERAASMTDESFETQSEALFLVPADDAYEFGCICLFLHKYNWAFRAFLAAAGKGNLPSQYYVGGCFLYGIDTTKKIVDAARWLTKCKGDATFGDKAKELIAIVDAELEKPENAGLKVKRGNK